MDTRSNWTVCPVGVLSAYVPSPTAHAIRMRRAHGPGKAGRTLAARASRDAAPDTGGTGADPHADLSATPRSSRPKCAPTVAVTAASPSAARTTSRPRASRRTRSRRTSGLTRHHRNRCRAKRSSSTTISEEYLAADHPVIALRSFGSDLKRGDQVPYSVSIPSLGGDATAPPPPRSKARQRHLAAARGRRARGDDQGDVRRAR